MVIIVVSMATQTQIRAGEFVILDIEHFARDNHVIVDEFIK